MDSTGKNKHPDPGLLKNTNFPIFFHHTSISNLLFFRHTRSVHGIEPRTKCSKCGRIVRDMEKHNRDFHSLLPVHACDRCDKKFASIDKLKTHMSTHTQGLKTCEICHAEVRIYVLFKLRDQQATVCQRSSDPFYIVTYYIKWVTTSLTHSILVFLLWQLAAFR